MRKWVVLWFASLVSVAALTAGLLAQSRLPEREYRIVSGNDVGFRTEGTDRSGKPIGTFMVRTDGRWVEVSGLPTPHPVTQ